MYADKLDHPFSHVFIFSNKFSESHGFVATHPVYKLEQLHPVYTLEQFRLLPLIR